MKEPIMKTCVIYGQNGLDLDVALNLTVFYKKLGFKTIFSSKLIGANLIVILRAVDSPLVLPEGFWYDQMHIYDYGGWEYESFIRSVDKSKAFFFTTSPEMSEKLKGEFSIDENKVSIMLPPVEVELWVSKVRKKEYDFVHIGNFKKDIQDLYRTNFLNTLDELNVKIWGLGWPERFKRNYLGKAGLFEVSKIYSKSKLALGLMYSFQRSTTFSGRFWHAPLNGCCLLSEPGKYSRAFPGVIEVEYNSTLNLATKFTHLDNQAIQNEAIGFWRKENEKCKVAIGRMIKHVEWSKSMWSTDFYLQFVVMKLRIVYQKMNIFKLVSLSK